MTDFIPPTAPRDPPRTFDDTAPSGPSTGLSGTSPLGLPGQSVPPPTHDPPEWGAPLSTPQDAPTSPSGASHLGIAAIQPRYPRRSLAIMALVMSVMGFFCVGITGILGMLMARSDLHWIENGATDRRYYPLAQAAFIIGMIGFLLWAVLLSAVGLFYFAASLEAS